MLAAAGAKAGRVVRLAAARNHVQAPAGLKTALIAMVSHDGKVDLVKATENKAAQGERLSARSARRLGFITQADAKQLASKNGGLLGRRRSVRLANDGSSSSGGSYSFK